MQGNLFTFKPNKHKKIGLFKPKAIQNTYFVISFGNSIYIFNFVVKGTAYLLYKDCSRVVFKSVLRFYNFTERSWTCLRHTSVPKNTGRTTALRQGSRLENVKFSTCSEYNSVRSTVKAYTEESSIGFNWKILFLLIRV